MAAGYKDLGAANLKYGEVGRKLAEEMGWSPPENDHGVPTWTYALATDADEAVRAGEPSSGHLGDWRWKMRPQVVEALTGEPPTD